MELDRYKTTLDSLVNKVNGIVEKYQWFDLLNSIEKESVEVKSYIIQRIDRNLQMVLKEEGKEIYEIFRMISILHFVINEYDTVCSDNYSTQIAKYFKENWERMLGYCNSGEGWSTHQHDIFWKDLALARLAMFPINAQVVEKYSGFGFRKGFSNGIFQRIRFLLFLIKSGGKKGYFQIHLHEPNLKYFSEESRIECYMEIAYMLKKHKEIKGAYGMSWYFDPQLKEISPWLSFLREFPLAGGAELFLIGKDESRNALAKSRNRLRLYEAGKYIPQSYLLVWPRKKLIAWASRKRLDNLSNHS